MRRVEPLRRTARARGTPIAAAVVMALGAVAASAAAAPPTQAEVAEATALFESGRSLFLEARYAEALAAFERSYAIAPSPNSSLLVARTLQRVGRVEDAATRYAQVEHEATERVAAGETRYAETLSAARREGEAVRRELGVLAIEVQNATVGVTLEIDGAAVALASSGPTERFHRPGVARVVVREASGRAVERSVPVERGGRADVRIDLQKPIASAPEPDRPASWLRPTAWVATGLGAVGLGLFAGFGLAARATYRDLDDRCGGHCGSESERADADDGERQQTIANVALVAGAVAIGAGVTLFLLSIGPSEPPAREAGARVVFAIGPGSAVARGTF